MPRQAGSKSSRVKSERPETQKSKAISGLASGMDRMKEVVQERKPSWTFLSNHAHVLLVLAGDPEIKLREVAERVGITERAVQRIITDLKAGRYIETERRGRGCRYRLHPELPLRHPVEAHRSVAHLLALILGS